MVSTLHLRISLQFSLYPLYFFLHILYLRLDFQFHQRLAFMHFLLQLYLVNLHLMQLLVYRVQLGSEFAPHLLLLLSYDSELTRLCDAGPFTLGVRRCLLLYERWVFYVHWDGLLHLTFLFNSTVSHS